ncbi:RNB domain-containing protein [Nakamurella panacisegetis]|uniref:RNB domain-containing protein n=1 Tax=Nakamurella panacisegetis TaxID=1090615 RepID=A0A1H0QZI5_9ACTN|nr:RNB domain-containing ribonuclease [Nakamurella panacisegetis]SDP22681.1 RNB domain-containing protein [Nakamurella panacisegetis]
MPIRRIHPPRVTAAVIDFPAIRARLGIPGVYPAAADAEAVAVAADPPQPALDRTDLPLVTIDPIGSMDLDQAMHLEKTPAGFVVHYAIADVASFVGETGALHDETWRRGETLYSPDLATPLHPRELSEGAASLLPDLVRPAALWRIELDPTGEPGHVRVERALVRSVARLDYLGVQADLDAGRLHPSIAALPEIGRLRQAAARRRHAISLDLPDAEVVPDAVGHWTLSLRAQNEIEKANAEISLLTGICAARMMMDAGIGLLRTLPPASADQVALLRKSAAALGIPWPDGVPAGDVIAELDSSRPTVAAFLDDAVHLLRGAGYTPFDGAVPAQPLHAGVGSIYAHVTAPLRRLADRYATEVCLALCAGHPVPPWVREALPKLSPVMAASGRRASDLERACTGAVSVFLLTGREGATFQATVLQVETVKNQATVLLHEPPVRARCAATGLTEGSIGPVRLVSVDQDTNTFVVAPVERTIPGGAVTLVAV